MTLVHIVNTLHRMESKLDQIVTPDKHQQPNQNTEVKSGSATLPPDIASLGIQQDAPQLFPEPTDSRNDRNRLTYANRIFTWPAIQNMLLSAKVQDADELRSMLKRGSGGFIEQQLRNKTGPLPYDEKLRCTPIPRLGNPTVEAKMTFPDLTIGDMNRYAEAFFTSFNMIYPILDHDDFMQDIAPLQPDQDFDEGYIASTLALSVFALGKLALEGTAGDPIRNDYALSSGIRGGSIKNPPGIEIFNEVRRRIGIVYTRCCVESAQILLLTA
jgi:hypothetical protein